MDDITNDPLFQANDELGAGNGAEAVDSSLTLQEINDALGKNFKDKTTALKAFKDTFSYVGKAGQVEKELTDARKKLDEKDSALSEIKGIKEELFYSKNSQYEPYRTIISKMGTNPAEVVQSEDFKKIFDGLTELDKTKSAKSVLVSNPRIGQAKTKLDEARELEKVGQYTSSRATAVDAVLEAYEIQ